MGWAAGDLRPKLSERRSVGAVLDDQRNLSPGANDRRIGKRCGDKKLGAEDPLQALLYFHQLGVGVRTAGNAANQHVAGAFVKQLAETERCRAFQALVEGAW